MTCQNYVPIWINILTLKSILTDDFQFIILDKIIFRFRFVERLSADDKNNEEVMLDLQKKSAALAAAMSACHKRREDTVETKNISQEKFLVIITPNFARKLLLIN